MYLYEDSIIKDINSLFVNSNVTAVIADTLDEALRRSAENKKDVTTLPLITLSGGDWILKDTSFYSIMHGSEFKRVEDEKLAKSTSILAFTPTYYMYIAASSSKECDMLTREILFHYTQNPTLTVKIPYGINDIHTFNIVFEHTVRKNQKPTGLVYRTLTFTLDGAYLWHNTTMNVVKDVDVDVEERYDESIVQN